MDLFLAVENAIKNVTSRIGTKADLEGAIPYVFSSFSNAPSKVVFVDGGQACILDSSDFSLHFIRVYAGVWEGMKFISEVKKEYYVLITPEKVECFGDVQIPTFSCIPEEQIGRIRRYLELHLASSFEGNVLLDGNLQAEEPVFEEMLKGKNALSKTNEVLSDVKSSVAVDLLKLAKTPTWKVEVAPNIFFVKFHPQSRYVFKVEGSAKIIDMISCHCSDASFLGYPYGLLHADKNARVSNEEKKYLQTRFLLSFGKDLAQHLNTKNAHDVLDTL